MFHRESCIMKLFGVIGNCTCAVQRLELRNCGLNDADLLRLAKALRSNASLQVLDLRQNEKITQQGIQSLVDELRYSDHPLHELQLPHVPAAEGYLLAVLRSNYSLSTVTVEGTLPRNAQQELLIQRNRDMASFSFIYRSASFDLQDLTDQLTEVVLTNSRLTVIPSQLFELKKMQVLDLRYAKSCLAVLADFLCLEGKTPLQVLQVWSLLFKGVFAYTLSCFSGWIKSPHSTRTVLSFS